MTTQHTIVETPQDILDHVRLYERLFNEGDADGVDRLYTEDSISAWEPDKPVGGEARRQEFAEFLRLRPTLSTKVLETHVTDDTALLVVDWTMDVQHPDEGAKHFAGVGIDVLRRGADGRWRHAVDSPYSGGRKD